MYIVLQRYEEASKANRLHISIPVACIENCTPSWWSIHGGEDPGQCIYPMTFLPDLTALAELQSEGGILDRRFLFLTGHVIKDGGPVGALGLDGLRMPLTLRGTGGLDKK